MENLTERLENLTGELENKYMKLKEIKSLLIIPDYSNPIEYLQIFLSKKLVVTINKEGEKKFNYQSLPFRLLHSFAYLKLKSL